MKADGEEKEKLGQELVTAVEKEIEPLLKDAAPFFGGSKVLTLAEVWVSHVLQPSPTTVKWLTRKISDRR